MHEVQRITDFQIAKDGSFVDASFATQDDDIHLRFETANILPHVLNDLVAALFEAQSKRPTIGFVRAIELAQIGTAHSDDNSTVLLTMVLPNGFQTTYSVPNQNAMTLANRILELCSRSKTGKPKRH